VTRLFPLAALAVFAVVLALLGGTDAPGPPAAVAQQQGAPVDDPAKPLVYVFSLDAQDGDRAIDAGEAPFLSRLIRGQEGGRATYYRESRGIMVAETNPNHVAMVTGAYGKDSGISGNTFGVYGAQAKRDCPGDGGSTDPTPEDQQPGGGAVQVTSGEAATCLRAETFFAALKRLAPDVVTAGIFGKPKLARIFETKRIDPQAFDADHLYAPCERSGPTRRTARTTRSTPSALHRRRFVMDEVRAHGRRGRQGRRARCDGPHLTFANFPDIDQCRPRDRGAGGLHDARSESPTCRCSASSRTRRRRGLWGRGRSSSFTSDHSMTPRCRRPGNAIESAFGATPTRSRSCSTAASTWSTSRTATARTATPAQAPAEQGAHQRRGRRGALPPAEPGRRRRSLHARRRAPGLEHRRERTGDLFVTSKPEQAFGDGVPSGINPLNGNHGAPQTRDNTFAIVSGGGQVKQQAIDGTQAPRFDDTLQNPQQAEQVDIAPTVMALFGRRPPADNAGRVLTEAFAAGALPAIVDPPGSGATGAPGAGAAPETCDPVSGFASLRITPQGRGLRFAFARRSRASVRFDVFRQSAGRTVLGNRLVARLRALAQLRVVRPRAARRDG
jgi:hypothetical protein